MTDISKVVSEPLANITGPLVLSLCLLVGMAVFFLYRKASQEILKRKAVQKALAESEGRYRALYNRTPAMLHSIDNNGNRTGWTDGTTTVSCTYNPMDRLTHLSDGTTTATYRYNGDGDRLAAVRNGTETRYVIDATGTMSDVIAETDNAVFEIRMKNRGLNGTSRFDLGIVGSQLENNLMPVDHFRPVFPQPQTGYPVSNMVNSGRVSATGPDSNIGMSGKSLHDNFSSCYKSSKSSNYYIKPPSQLIFCSLRSRPV